MDSEKTSNEETKTVVEAKVKAEKTRTKAKKLAKKSVAKGKATKAQPKRTKAHLANLAVSARKRALDSFVLSDYKVTAKDHETRIREAIALYFVKYRKENNLSQRQLGERLGTDGPRIVRIESGKYVTLGLDTIFEYAKKMAVKPADITSFIWANV